LGCHGNPIIRTPNLDRLHGQSVRLTNFHTRIGPSSLTSLPTRRTRRGTWPRSTANRIATRACRSRVRVSTA
jgi:hypothetical protein